MASRIRQYYFSVVRSNFIRNSFWGLSGRMVETLFLSLFFVILSRYVKTSSFAQFLIATNLYQLVVGFSSMGLGDWFIRELHYEQNKADLIYRFLKIQIGLGVLFYFINLILAFTLYNDVSIRIISVILGTNIIFDNVIYAIKSLNIAQSQQKKSAYIMIIDSSLKLLFGCLLFIYPVSVIMLSCLLVIARLFTVNMFIYIGASRSFNLTSILRHKILPSDLKKHVLSNWRFVIIVGLSIIFWRSATIIISKFFALSFVANYEIAYKLFSIFMIIPVIASTTIYPQFVKYSTGNNHAEIKTFYRKIFLGYTILSVISYAFIQSFADAIVPLIFGNKYHDAIGCLKDMFLTFLVFPSALLQANLLVALKLEKKDMHFNMVALAIYLTGSLLGLQFYKSLAVINYAIFGSFLVFHMLQNHLLGKLKFTSGKSSIIFYAALAAFVITYRFAVNSYNTTIVFGVFLLLLCVSTALYFIRHHQKKIDLSKALQKNLMTHL